MMFAWFAWLWRALFEAHDGYPRIETWRRINSRLNVQTGEYSEEVDNGEEK